MRLSSSALLKETPIPPATVVRKIAVPDEGAESLFGTYDENLKHLEGLFNVRIRTNGQELIVEGDAADVRLAEKVLEQLSSLVRGGYKLGKGDVKTASQLVAQDENVELADLVRASVVHRGFSQGLRPFVCCTSLVEPS